MLDVVVPVHNEEVALRGGPAEGVPRHLPWTWRVTIADNASRDGTPLVGRQLAHTDDRVRDGRLEGKGRGRALKRVWAADADVPSNGRRPLHRPQALMPLVAPIVSGHSDLAIGTRLARGSRVVRGPNRELISRAYNRPARHPPGPVHRRAVRFQGDPP